jgi:CheY-like chemotaxis protein
LVVVVPLPALYAKLPVSARWSVQTRKDTRLEIPHGREPPIDVKRIVLSIEDDNSVYFLIPSALDDLALGFELRRSVNGDEALEFLRQSGNFCDALRPSLILLDMNLPRIGGPQVLAAIQADESIRDIPVVIFSSSRLEADRA